MNISHNGIMLICYYEGCRLTAYQDQGGVWTIGWGRIAGVYPGMTCTQEEADQWLFDEISRFEAMVNAVDSTYHWTQNEFDALVSFAYNVGNIKGVTNNYQRTKPQIADAMLRYNKVNGAYSLGLDRRRHAENELFTTGVLPQFIIDGCPPNTPQGGGQGDGSVPVYPDTPVDPVFGHKMPLIYRLKPYRKRMR